VPTEPPLRFRRSRARRWELTRTLSGYRAAPKVGIGGKAPKWVLTRNENTEDYFIAKHKCHISARHILISLAPARECPACRNQIVLTHVFAPGSTRPAFSALRRRAHTRGQTWQEYLARADFGWPVLDERDGFGLFPVR
jgi:hypothetical protein